MTGLTCLSQFLLSPFKMLHEIYVTYSRTPVTRINWDGEPSGYAENLDNWIFLSKLVTLGVWNLGVTVCSLYLHLNLSSVPNSTFWKS